MVINSKIDNDEINLIELIFTLWEGKWKIAVAVVVSCIATMIYQPTSTPNKNFTAITEIKPVNTLAIKKYTVLNNTINHTINNSGFNFAKITKTKLLDSYIDILNDKSVFEDAIRKFNLLDASQYNDDQEYSEAVIKLASSIKILPPPANSLHYTINFTYDDAKKWKSALIYVDKSVSPLVKQSLVEDFNLLLSVSKNLKRYKLEGLIMERDHNLEDLTIKIKNLLDDYDRSTSDRLEYLKEQSKIAEELGIENSTIAAEKFNFQSGLLMNIQTSTPFYLKGYKTINKEIDLISNRPNKKPFIKELYELEKSQRALEQDKSIERIEKDRSLDLLKEIKQSSPLEDNNDFHAASVNIFATKYEYEDEDKSNKNPLLLAIAIGLIAGIFYVLISDAFQSHRVSRKKTN